MGFPKIAAMTRPYFLANNLMAARKFYWNYG